MSHECLFARVLAIDSIIPTTQGDKVIPYPSMAINRFLQFTIPVIAIHFELVRFHYRIRFSGFHALYERVWEAPPSGGVIPSHENHNNYTIFRL